uniref:Ribosome-recycling factor, mitochondrial n=1 Tax=Pogona vitticeps TaxID=103695 RepID=A0ABM5F5D0_9SAUR
MAGFLRCLRQLAPVVCSSAKLSLRAPINYRVLLWHGCRDSWILPTLPTRHLATKKAKAKGKGQARVNINISLVEDIINLEEANQDMQAVVTDLQEEFNKTLNIRTSPGAFHHITVVTSSGKFPLNELAQITLKSPQLMLVNMSNFPESHPRTQGEPGGCGQTDHQQSQRGAEENTYQGREPDQEGQGHRLGLRGHPQVDREADPANDR